MTTARSMVSGVAHVIQKIREAGPGKASLIIRDSLKRALAPKVVKDVIVYRLDRLAYAGGPAVPRPDGLCVERYERIAGIPAAVLETVEADERAAMLRLFQEQFDAGGTLYVGTIKARMAAFQWSIKGSRLKQWFVPLRPEDVVIYAASTFNMFRGRGIHSAMIRHIIEREDGAGIEIYCDTTAWNTVAQRNIEKAGYRKLTIIRRSAGRPDAGSG